MTSVPAPGLRRNTRTIREGREFCAFGLHNNISCVPVDETENLLFDGFIERLHIDELLPIVPDEILRVLVGLESPNILDCGYGTGIWIHELLNILDNVDNEGIIGIDIFDRQSTGVQQFHKLPCDLNAEFLADWTDHFDMINSRFLIDGINKNRWPLLILEYKRLLKPGGWLQMVEARWKFHSGSGHALPKLKTWSDAYTDALNRMQKDPCIKRRLEWLVRSAGFELVEGRIRNIPVGNWRPEDGDEEDEEDVSIIRYVHAMLESFALVTFMQTPGRTMQDCMQVVQAAQAELRTPDADIYFEMIVVYGRRSMN